ncbi:CDGSH iron-sulfur domain-containing protein [Actinomadura keratinilytica]|uniref:Iron-binding zinc finger CDGSH type domain-containing protein n=1 Tax=Actinomadura keratinilytica TaxID=547461 RepID=A0ABP7YX27_9ACTN
MPTTPGPGDEATAPGGAAAPPRRRVLAERGGPILVEGPVEVVLPDGTSVASDRFMVALCACGASGRYPFCDTSHRRCRRTRDRRGTGSDTASAS